MPSKQLLILATAVALVATTVPITMGVASLAAPATSDYAVHGADAAEAISGAGGRVIDDYGVFATAALTQAGLEALALHGFTLVPLSHETGRGAYRFDGRVGDAAVPSDLRADGSDLVLVQFRGPVKAEWRAALDGAAEAVYDYLPYDSFVARMTPDAQADFAAREEVLFLGAYHPAFKLSTELPTEGVADVLLVVYKDADLDAVLKTLESMGVPARAWTDTSEWEDLAKVTLPAERVAELAQLPDVAWIEPTYDTQDVLDNAASVAITMTGTTTGYSVGDKGVDGSSQVSSICDTGSNTNGGSPTFSMVHEMLADPTQSLTLGVANPNHRKVLMYYAPIEGGVKGDNDDADGHGTHTSGTLAGNAGAAGRDGNDGFNLAGKVMICDITTGFTFNILTNYANYWDPAYANGARVNSNSWGSTHTNAYTEKARQHDQYVWTHRDMNILRSMGNTGPSGMIRPEAVAKSAFGVGATQNGAAMENLASFSTRGPTADNRLKPEVVAPGDCLMSSYLSSSTSYACLSGTSMSTPSMSGAATLVRDYLAKGFYPDGVAGGAGLNPSTALVRAMLINSGKQMTGSGTTASYTPWMPSALPAAVTGPVNTALAAQGASFPNGAQGFGRVTLEDVLYFAGDARKLWIADEGAGLTTGGTATFTLNVVDATIPLEITLAWSDYPGAAGASPALVNDLDMTVLGPSLLPLNGNVLLNGESAALPVKDGTNVVEAVILRAPTPGTYTITITGASVANGPQPFALVATGGIA